jgi:hypothetical protein
MTSTAEQLYDSQTFEEFWEHYQAMHQHPVTRAMHATATTSAIGLLVLALKRRSLALAIAAPIVDYAISQSSHRLFERNATKPYKRPLWHALAELRMWRASIGSRSRWR